MRYLVSESVITNWLEPYLEVEEREGEVHVAGIDQQRPLTLVQWETIHDRVSQVLLLGSVWPDIWRLYGMMVECKSKLGSSAFFEPVTVYI